VCANTLEYVVGKAIGIESADLRIHPTAPGEVGVQVTYRDGTVVWLVAEDTQTALDLS
jgi:hypothetical protein